MLRLLSPRRLLIAALAACAGGIAALYAGYPSIGPIGLLAAILCTIMAAILMTTPQAAVEAAYARRAAEGSPADGRAPASQQPASPSVESDQHDTTHL